MRVLLPDCPPPHVVHARLASRFATSFLLESRDGPRRLARYSLLGFDPLGTVTLDEAGLRASPGLPPPTAGQPPFDYLRRLQEDYATRDGDAPFVGGLVGAAGYDLARTLEPSLKHSAPPPETEPRARQAHRVAAAARLAAGAAAPTAGAAVRSDAVPSPEAAVSADLHRASDAADEPAPWPRLLVGLYLDGIVFDHEQDTAHYVSRGPDRHLLVEDVLASDPPARDLRAGPLRSSVDAAQFIHQVRQAQELIRAGEAFQIVLSRAFHGTFEGSLVPLYAWLRDHAPVPYLFHLRFAGRQIVGASPECLVRVRGGLAETFPIAGTRPVTGDAAQDAAAGNDLRADAKETAEHAMLVDLARNDLGRVCTPGTVKVAAYQELHGFRDVMHLVSRVEGRLAPGQDAWSALAAVFPAGTVSGAPKVRAMEHIDALENAARHPRGAYAGAVCYASFNGDFDSAITIRSLSAQDGRLTVQAGAGIVHRSDPHSEWLETGHKARTLLSALAAFGATVDEGSAPGPHHAESPAGRDDTESPAEPRDADVHDGHEPDPDVLAARPGRPGASARSAPAGRLLPTGKAVGHDPQRHDPPRHDAPRDLEAP